MQASALSPGDWEWFWDRLNPPRSKNTYQSALRKLGLSRSQTQHATVRADEVRWVDGGGMRSASGWP